MGEFYLLEGGMATGKTSVLNELSKIAIEEDIDASFNKSPMEKYSGPRSHIDSQESTDSKALWYLWHSHPISEWVEEEVGQGKDVVLDRYWPTTVAYYDSQVDIDLETIVDEMNLVDPDKVYYLTASKQTRRERLQMRGRGDNRDDERGWEKNAIEAYERIMGRFNTEEISTDDKTVEETGKEIAYDAGWFS
ncbi:MAG: hypothetical protein MUP63_00310 [Candidatus Nanohaloarchaeota archaeon QJJ-7]|nr:hypothetical protein [Candidatus Nanohaloarchaeota archaeon QJJ-7]